MEFLWKKHLQLGDAVLLIGNPRVSVENLMMTRKEIEFSVGTEGSVAFEQVDRLHALDLGRSKFNVILSGVMWPVSEIHSEDLLMKFMIALKPNGSLIVGEPFLEADIDVKRTREFILYGFVECKSTLHSIHQETVGLQDGRNSNSMTIIQIHVKKPMYEVGAVVPLPNRAHTNNSTSVSRNAAALTDSANAWITAANEEEGGLSTTFDNKAFIDESSLLDPSDFVPPSLPINGKESLSGCGPAKRKPCKNCTCGRAGREQEEQTQGQKKTATIEDPNEALLEASSCGSCYLGDAFRCTSCPYRGLPPFKPGEQVRLNATQLQPDIE